MSEVEKATEDLKSGGIRVIDDTKKSFKFAEYDKIEKALTQNIHKTDLYDWLGKTQSESITAIKNAHTLHIGKTDSKSTAILTVCGSANIIFDNNDEKERYDDYLATKNIWEKFASLKKTGLSEMVFEEYSSYFETVRKTLRKSDPDTCPHCGRPLKLECWNCGGKSKKGNCPSCGAVKEDEARFVGKEEH